MITPAGYKTTKNNNARLKKNSVDEKQLCAGTCLYCAISEGKVSATIFELWAATVQLCCAQIFTLEIRMRLRPNASGENPA